MIDRGDYLRNAVDASDVEAASRLKEERLEGEDAWSAHLSLFPAVQRVLNPPFINPHMPKMYAVCRDLLPYMQAEDIFGLLCMETTEYARRQKLEKHPRSIAEDLPDRTPMPFGEVENAVRSRDVLKTASRCAVYLRRHGALEFARRLLLMGSGYLVESLGHSVSCTAFILREMITRKDQDPWPTLVLLADYFIKGRFDRTPPLHEKLTQALPYYLQHATTGSSFADIHHTITLYAIDRARELFNQEEFDHCIARCVEWMGKKESHSAFPETPKADSVLDYGKFFQHFSALDREAVLAMIFPLAASGEGRRQLGHFLVRGLCDMYQGNYNPHYVTGLGAMLWVAEKFPDHPPLVSNALNQHLSFLFRELGKDIAHQK